MQPPAVGGHLHGVTWQGFGCDWPGGSSGGPGGKEERVLNIRR